MEQTRRSWQIGEEAKPGCSYRPPFIQRNVSA